MSAVHAHGALEELADGLHAVEGAWRRSPLRRRMTVLRLADGGLALHSAMRLDEEGLRHLDRLGTVRYILVPNRFHASDAPFHAARSKKARVLVPSGALEHLHRAWAHGRGRIDGTLEDDWAPELQEAADRLPLAGTRLHEVAVLHRASRTLVLTDLCFNYGPGDFSGSTRLFMTLNGATRGLGPSRLMRWAFTRDREALGRSLAELLEWEFDRVIVSHGDVVETGGREALRAGLAPLLP